ncbi:hypothetical protein AB832_07765 [Flavobacteriaceae bacterium (ex Bugula neritina AB1)]|nr:hypothetical protein AB832_07765 [Flavobacteriaceae bacterium (ex Bugula neritina AB1)]
MNINKNILAFAKEQIKEKLKKLPKNNVDFFMRMYNYKNVHNSIDEVLEHLEFHQINHALNQIENTIKQHEPKS